MSKESTQTEECQGTSGAAGMGSEVSGQGPIRVVVWCCCPSQVDRSSPRSTPRLWWGLNCKEIFHLSLFNKLLKMLKKKYNCY